MSLQCVYILHLWPIFWSKSLYFWFSLSSHAYISRQQKCTNVEPGGRVTCREGLMVKLPNKIYLYSNFKNTVVMCKQYIKRSSYLSYLVQHHFIILCINSPSDHQIFVFDISMSLVHCDLWFCKCSEHKPSSCLINRILLSPYLLRYSSYILWLCSNEAFLSDFRFHTLKFIWTKSEICWTVSIQILSKYLTFSLNVYA